MLKVLNNKLNFNYYTFFLLNKLEEFIKKYSDFKYTILKEGKNMKKYIILLTLMFSLVLMATVDRTYNEVDKRLNSIVTLRVMGVTPDKIWEKLGVDENINLYFNEIYNLYECKNFLINNENCTRIKIADDFLYHIKVTSTVRGYTYIFNYNDEITKENSYIIAKNYVIDENYTYDENTGVTIDNDCTIDSENNCIISDSTINNIIENLTPYYNNWRNSDAFYNNYENLKTDIDITSGISDDGKIYYGKKSSSLVGVMPYDAIRLSLTTKILNDLNISFSRVDVGGIGSIYYNHNSEVETDFSCEIYKITGFAPSGDLFNLDTCNLENTFSSPNNIIGVEKRVLYQKMKKQENSDLYFDEISRRIKIKEISNDSDLEIVNPEYQLLEAKLTNEWSDDLIVNTFLFKDAEGIDFDLSFLFSQTKTNQNLWALVSNIINKTFKFYEKKEKAKAKIKQLMELKSIGLLSNYRWQALGFNSYGNNDKSEIEVDELIDLYDGFYQQDLNALTNVNSKKVFENSGYNSLFLAFMLQKLNLKLIDGRILKNNDATYITKLIKLKDDLNKFNEYKIDLLAKKDTIINSELGDNKEYLSLFFRLQTLNKFIEVLKTNGFKKTIPEFKSWLEYQRDDGIYSEYYSEFVDEYIVLIDEILEIPKEDYVSPIRGQLSDSYLGLLYDIEQKANFGELSEIYNTLETIEIITRDYSNQESHDYNLLKPQEIARYLMDVREVSPTYFQYLVLNTENLFYSQNTNIYYLYKLYKENIFTNTSALIENNIMIFKDTEEVFNSINSYAEFSYYLGTLLISNHHSIYEIAGEIIKNLSFSEKNGVNFDKWIEALSKNGIEASNIWEFFGIERDSLLSENAEKNINVKNLVSRYDILERNVKEYLGLSTSLYSKDDDLSSRYFDPITSLLLSRILVEKGYYIDKDEEGYDAIFDVNGEITYLSLEIDSLIKEIGDRYNLFDKNFTDIFTNDSLSDYLGNINQGSVDLNKMMSFVNFSYTKDLRTGERNISFTFAVDNIADSIIWNRITGGIGNRAGFWGDLAKAVFSKAGAKAAANIVGGAIVSVVIAEVYNGIFGNQKQIENERRILYRIVKQNNQILKDMIAFKPTRVINLGEITINASDYDFLYNEIYGFIDEGFSNSTIIAIYKTRLSNINDYLDKSYKDLTNLNDNMIPNAEVNFTISNTKKAKDNLEKLKEKKEKLNEAIKKAEKDKKEAETNLNDVKDGEIINDLRKEKEETETKEKNEPAKMCRPDTYDTECDSGVGPAGHPALILSQLGGMGARLLEEISAPFLRFL
jgi:hypothetical protein